MPRCGPALEFRCLWRRLPARLLRPSSVPPRDIRRLRIPTRYRVQLMGDRTGEATRLELMLEDASIKLSGGRVQADHRLGVGPC